MYAARIGALRSLSPAAKIGRLTLLANLASANAFGKNDHTANSLQIERSRHAVWGYCKHPSAEIAQRGGSDEEIRRS